MKEKIEKIKKKSDRGRLVKRYLEHKNCKDYKLVLGRKQRGIGIYVLYKRNKIYYIGLSKRSLRSRIRKHALNDKHKGKWDNFSFYQVGRTKYIKDIESLFLRIAKPNGNRAGGKFKKEYDLGRRIKQIKIR